MRHERMRLCDICRERRAERMETVVENGASVSYAYCEACYRRALAAGMDPIAVARQSIARIGLECPSCGCTAEEFEARYLFGCPDCYRHMNGVAGRELARLRQGAGGSDVVLDELTNEQRGRVRDYVVSSRVRLARNIEGLPFPRKLEQLAGERLAGRYADAVDGLRREAVLAAKGIFDGDIYYMAELDAIQKAMLLERHIISLPLAKSDLGAVIIERGDRPEMSIMLCEEDHIRAQCVRQGLDLAGAYSRLKKYDEALGRRLPIAYDSGLGYLTACPTNVGTGMRASVMMFLPALKCTGRLEDAFDELRERFGITVRGFFGEGSEAAYDMYQMSNADTIIFGGEDTVRLVESAAMELAAMESDATRELLYTSETKLLDRIQRSYGTLLHAHTLESDEMFELLTDVRLGVRLGLFKILPEQLDGILDDLATAFEIIGDDLSAERRGVRRAQIVRERLGAI